MMANIRVDLSEFETVMPEYVAAKKSTFAREITRQVGQLALRAAMNSPHGNKGSIDWIPSDARSRAGRTDPKNQRGGNTPWWPAFIQKVLNNGGFVLRGRRKVRTAAERDAGYIDPATGRKISTRRTMGFSRLITNQAGGDVRRRGDLQRISKKILDRRASTFGAIGGMFGKIASEFGGSAGRRIDAGSGVMSGMRFPKWGSAAKFWSSKEATADDLKAGFVLPFGSRYASDWPDGKRPSREATALGKQRMAVAALEAGRDDVIADMREHIVNLMQFRDYRTT